MKYQNDWCVEWIKKLYMDMVQTIGNIQALTSSVPDYRRSKNRYMPGVIANYYGEATISLIFSLMFTKEIEAHSKAEWVVDYIIQHWPVWLPELRKLVFSTPYWVGWLACISTHISDGRKYARKKWYEIRCNLAGKKIGHVEPIYYAEEVWIQ